MNNELHNAIMLFQKEKGISADVLCEKICLAVSTAAKKEFGLKDGEIICTMDPETYDIDDEYLFCEDLLVAPICYGRGDEHRGRAEI